MLEKFSWLHLSDFHFKASGDGFGQEVSCGAVLRDIPSRLSNEYPLQFAVVTGDVAFSGRADEYALASVFFDSLAAQVGVELSRLFVAPGNHDVDRSIQSYMYEGVRSKLTNQQAVDEFLGRERERNQLMERQSAFRDFRYRLLSGAQIEDTDDGLAHLGLLDLGGFRVCVLELNSTWLSGPQDQAGNLVIGERQIISALDAAEHHSPHLLVALSHHPPDWLAEFDSVVCGNRLVQRIDIFHTGHLHRHETSIALKSRSQCLHSAAGSTHETRHYRNAYNLIEYDIGDAVCRIRQFEYDSLSGGYQEMEGTEYPLPLTRELQVSAAKVANALRGNLPATEPYADYMAALWTGDLDEVPISLGDDGITFASRRMPLDYQIREVLDFLRISNLLRVYDQIPLDELILGYQIVISKLADLLSKTASADPQFAEMLINRRVQAQKIAGPATIDDSPFQSQYLDDLARAGDSADLIDAATRYQKSSSEAVRIAACRHLASALCGSSDLESRKKGLELAFHNVDQHWSGAVDYCVAAAAAESFDDPERAERAVITALEFWPMDPQLREYCRSLITRTGSRNLRRHLDETAGNPQ